MDAPKKAGRPRRNPSKTHLSGKIDLKKAFELRYLRGLTQPEIAQYFDCTTQAVSAALLRFENVLKSSRDIDLYTQNRGRVLDALEMELVFDMFDGDRRQKASLNNVGYVFDKVSIHNRLEQGKATANVALHSILERLDARPPKSHKSSNPNTLDAPDVPDAPDGCVVGAIPPA